MPVGKQTNGVPWWRFYCRIIGVFQWLYAALFGWLAFLCLSSVVQREGTFKGVYIPPINVFHLAEGTMFALLTVSGLIGGWGLFRLRAWTRWWEVAYILSASTYALAFLAIETRRGHDLGDLVPIYLVFTLPYLAFVLFSSGSELAFGVGTQKRTGAIVDELDGI